MHRLAPLLVLLLVGLMLLLRRRDDDGRDDGGGGADPTSPAPDGGDLAIDWDAFERWRGELDRVRP